jgi:hypothetical protein
MARNEKSCKLMPVTRVSSKQTKINFGSNRNKLKQDLFRVFFGLFRETKKNFFSVCFGVSNLYRNNRNKHNCFETNRNNPEFSEKYQNMLSKHNQPARLRKNKKKPFELSTMQGTETIYPTSLQKKQNPPLIIND